MGECKGSLSEAKEVIKTSPLTSHTEAESVLQSHPVNRLSVQKKTSPTTKFDAVKLTLHLIYSKWTSVWNWDPHSKLEFCLRPRETFFFPFSFVLGRKKKPGWECVSGLSTSVVADRPWAWTGQTARQAACQLSWATTRAGRGGAGCRGTHTGVYDNAFVRPFGQGNTETRYTGVDADLLHCGKLDTYSFCALASVFVTLCCACFYS